MRKNETPARFVIMAAPRTGSNMLCTLLNSHPDILCHHEIFNPDGVFYALDLRNDSFSMGTIEERDRDPVGFLARVWKNSLGFACVGFKITHRQNEVVFGSLFGDKELKIIILRRRNRIKTFVSWQLALQTGQWEVYRQSDLPARPITAKVDLVALRRQIGFNEGYYEEIREALLDSGQEHLETCYEDLFSVQEQSRMLRFLGLPDLHPDQRVQSVKQNPKDLREIVSNFDELEIALRGSDLEKELHSVDY